MDSHCTSFLLKNVIVILLVLNSSQCAPAAKPSAPKNMYTDLIEKCPLLQKIDNFPKDEVIKQCPNWPEISKITELTERNEGEVRCLLLHDRISTLCNEIETVKPVDSEGYLKPTLISDTNKVCSEFSFNTLQHDILKVGIDNKIACIKLCLPFDGQFSILCNLAHFYASVVASVKKPVEQPPDTIESKQDDKKDEITGKQDDVKDKKAQAGAVPESGANAPHNEPKQDTAPKDIKPEPPQITKEADEKQNVENAAKKPKENKDNKIATQPHEKPKPEVNEIKAAPEKPAQAVIEKKPQSGDGQDAGKPVKGKDVDKPVNGEDADKLVNVEDADKLVNGDDAEKPVNGEDVEKPINGDDAEEQMEEQPRFSDKEEEKPVEENPANNEAVPQEEIVKIDTSVSDNMMEEMNGDSYFFSYFTVLICVFIVGYIGYHNRQKLLALMLEGNRGRRQHRGRRPNSSNYHKLDSNLEEAISSSCSKNTTHIIY